MLATSRMTGRLIRRSLRERSARPSKPMKTKSLPVCSTLLRPRSSCTRIRVAATLRSRINRNRARIRSCRSSTFWASLGTGAGKFVKRRAQKLESLRSQARQAVVEALPIMVRKRLRREIDIGVAGTQCQMKFSGPAAKQVSGIEIGADQFVGVGGAPRLFEGPRGDGVRSGWA